MGIMKKSPSVDEIMKGFTKTLEQLDKVITSNLETKANQLEAAQDAKARANAADAEATRAARIATKINDLIG